jgi:hypothetical protein
MTAFSDTSTSDATALLWLAREPRAEIAVAMSLAGGDTIAQAGIRRCETPRCVDSPWRRLPHRYQHRHRHHIAVAARSGVGKAMSLLVARTRLGG